MKKIAYFLPSLALYALIFLVSSQSLGFSVPGQWLDKIPHALVYGAMGFLLSLGFFHLLPSSAGFAVILSFLSGSVLGALDEVHQKYTRGRVSDPKDAVADAIGVAVGIAVYWYLRRRVLVVKRTASPRPLTASTAPSGKRTPPSGRNST